MLIRTVEELQRAEEFLSGDWTLSIGYLPITRECFVVGMLNRS